MMVWIAEISLAPIIKVSSKEIGAILMIWKFIMYQTSCFLIVANNLLLNYDLMQMIVSPYNRNVRKTVRWVDSIAGSYVLLVYIIVPLIKMHSILSTEDKI
jgi:L-cystine uptake protein TcyP (sodium:dicarboxylate symporter family)